MQTPSKTFQGNTSFQRQKGKQTAPKRSLNDYKVACTHLIDGIYQGFVNASYQRDGFGIMQTDQFQTYLGYFKYNRPNGLGLIIYTDGSIIYSHFCNGRLQGIGLADNGHQIQLGTYKDKSIVGIGFEYSYNNHVWKMNSYHKGVPIQVIKEQTFPIEEGVPSILSLQSEILSLYLNYTKKNYFSRVQLSKGTTQIKQDLNSFYVHSLNESKYFFGYLIDNKFSGLGCIYDFKNRQICEVGMYRDGIFNGYGMKNNSIMSYLQSGYYTQGKKDGVFHVKKGNRSKFPEYNKDTIVFDNKADQTLLSLKKRQKIYYYRQKDFLSLRNNLEIESFQVLFQSSQYKAWKVQQQSDKKQKGDRKNPFQSKIKVKQTPKNYNPNSNLGHEKTSVQIMKEKVFNLMSNNKDRRNRNNQKSVIMLNNSKQMQGMDNTSFQKIKQDDQIAIQQNPIQLQQNHFITNKKTVSFNQRNNLKQQ